MEPKLSTTITLDPNKPMNISCWLIEPSRYNPEQHVNLSISQDNLDVSLLMSPFLFIRLMSQLNHSFSYMTKEMLEKQLRDKEPTIENVAE